MTYTSLTDAVHSIIEQYPQEEWIPRIQAEYPEVTRDDIRASIAAAYEVMMGGDVITVDDEGQTVARSA